MSVLCVPMQTVQSVERALALLDQIGRRPGRLVELTDRVQLPTSTVARLLATLEEAHAVQRDDDGTYRIGRRIRQMRGTPDPVVDLQTMADPHLMELSRQLDEAACLSIVVGRDTVTIRQVDGPKPIRVEDWTGERIPHHAGSVGLVVLATWPADELDAFLDVELTRFTDRTITDPAVLRARIADTVEQRVAWSEGEYVDGLTSCASAIVGPDGRAVGALYAYGPAYRFPPDDRADDIAQLVRRHAAEVSVQLGYQPGMQRPNPGETR